MDDHYPQRVFYNRPQIACPALSDGLCPARRSRAGSRNLRINFLPSHPLRLLAHNEPRRPSDRSSRVYPPDCYQLSQAGISSLLRIHLPPRTASKGLEFPLVPSLPDPSTKWIETIRGFPSYLWLPVSYRILNHVTGYDQVSGFALCCTLTHPQRRIRFACAMCSLLPIASFRPCRCQQRPCDSDCLPPDQGDVCILQQAGFASSAGQTTKRAT